MTEAVSAIWRARIREKLRDIAREEGVTILLAVESGSRAWGFHSADSDYDVRFIYSRPIDWHLKVHPGRDVIERPVSNELDLSGWDLRKTLGLMLGSNAVALEWLQSPIIYDEQSDFRATLTRFARQSLRRIPVMWHYRRLAERQLERQRNPDGSLRFKKYFYTVRPVLALRWLRLHPDCATPPMDMAGLMNECDLADDLCDTIYSLIENKKNLAESDVIQRTPPLTDALIDDELAHAREELAVAKNRHYPSQHLAADSILSAWTRRCDPSV